MTIEQKFKFRLKVTYGLGHFKMIGLSMSEEDSSFKKAYKISILEVIDFKYFTIKFHNSHHVIVGTIKRHFFIRSVLGPQFSILNFGQTFEKD